jgi:phosphopantothenoylcysteine decarboxylase/phosphopantothenate--cysteine ligase
LRILLGITGGVAAFKSASILRLLIDRGHEVRVVATDNALQFIGETTLANLSGHKVNKELYQNTEDGAHIELAEWAEKILIAPLTASTLGRLANGIATDLLTNVVMASSSELTVAPAMHSNMYTSAPTQKNLQALREHGVVIIEPVVGRLSGGDSGIGRLPEPEQIVDSFLGDLPLSGISACVTLGGTQEPLDPVRFIGNRSSGKQGLAFANELRSLGASVKIIAANVDLPSSNIEVSTVTTFEDLDAEMANLHCDLLVMAAAVSDYSVEKSSTKIERSDELELRLVPTPDLVAKFKKNNPSTTVLAFSVGDDDSDWLAQARLKQKNKGVEFVFANTTQTFGSETNSGVLICEKEYEMSGTKSEIAKQVLKIIQKSLVK